MKHRIIKFIIANIKLLFIFYMDALILAIVKMTEESIVCCLFLVLGWIFSIIYIIKKFLFPRIRNTSIQQKSAVFRICYCIFWSALVIPGVPNFLDSLYSTASTFENTIASIIHVAL